MRFIKVIFKTLIWFIVTVVVLLALYIGNAKLSGNITVNNDQPTDQQNHTFYLNSNGVHLDLVLPTELLSSSLSTNLNLKEQDAFIGFGWGDKGFYLNTPTWNELSYSVAFRAMFLKSETLMHVTKHKKRGAKWLSVKISQKQVNLLISYIENSFRSSFREIEDSGYQENDTFYLATGNYHCFNTCNSWVNTALKTAKLKACYWTPFDDDLVEKYK